MGCVCIRKRSALPHLQVARRENVTRMSPARWLRKVFEVHMYSCGYSLWKSFSYSHVATWRPSSAFLPSASNAMPVHGLSQRKSSVQQSRSQTPSPKMCKASDRKNIKRYRYHEVSPKSKKERLSACGHGQQGYGGCGERHGRCRRAWRWCRCCTLCRRRRPARQ